MHDIAEQEVTTAEGERGAAVAASVGKAASVVREAATGVAAAEGEAVFERDLVSESLPRAAIRKLRTQGVLKKNRHWLRVREGVVITAEGVQFLNNLPSFSPREVDPGPESDGAQKSDSRGNSAPRRARADLRIERIMSNRDKFVLARMKDGAGPQLTLRLQSTRFLVVGSLLRECIQGDDPRTWYYQGKLPKRKNQRI